LKGIFHYFQKKKKIIVWSCANWKVLTGLSLEALETEACDVP